MIFPKSVLQRSKERGGKQTEKFAEKLFCFSISYRVGLIVPLKSVICLSQKRVNDRFHSAAAPHGAGEMSLHTAPCSSPGPCCGKGSRTPKAPAWPWRRELRRRAGDWERQPRPTESSRRGEIRAGDGGRLHQPGFLPPLLTFPEKVKNTQVNPSENSGNYCYLNSTTLHRNKGKNQTTAFKL